MNNATTRSRAPIVIGACLVQFTVIGGVFAYGVFFSALETELGWSRTVLSACTSLAILIMGLFAVSAGRLNDHFGPGWVLAASGIVYGCGYARGRMTGVVKVGTAMGQIIVPILAAVLLATFGWRDSFLLLGLAAVAILLIAARLVGGKPPQAPDTGTHNSSHQHLNFKDIYRTTQFKLFCAIQLLFFPALTTIPVHIVVHAEDLGFNARSAAAILSCIGAASIIGRLVLGWGIDKIGGKQGYIVCFTLLLTSLLLLKQIHDPRYLYGFAIIYGLAHGGFFTVVSPTLAEFFGMRAIGTVFGTVRLITH